MTFYSYSKATTPQEFQQELLDYLQRLAIQRFNEKREIELEGNRKALIKEKIAEFHQICSIRDFITEIQFGDSP